MNRAAKIALTIAGILFALVIILGAVGFTAVRRPFPTTAGALTVPGLKAPVDVYRDEYGIPHIYAQNEHDLFFAQGYIHAQDRFWQMEFWRHIGQGRIAEIAGPSAAPRDEFIRTFGWNRIAADIADYYQREAPEFYAILEAYSAGVNAYIAANEGALALQINILGLVNQPWEIEAWTPVNTVSWGVVMSHDLASNYGRELATLERLQTFTAEQLRVAAPGYPYGKRPVIVPGHELTIMGQIESVPAYATAVDWRAISTQLIGEPVTLGFGEGPFIGSNNWVISGEHTASGLPLLANDPHLGVQMPSIWYEVGLHAPGIDVVGFSFAGVPGVIIGHTGQIAWGVTTSSPDVQDLYIIRTNPDNPNQYEYMGEWREMAIIEEVIKVNGGEEIVLPVRLTVHGPIVTEVIDSDDKPLTDVLAVRWAAAEPSRILQAVILLNKAQNYSDFYEAIRYWDIPSQSIVYADVEGNIGYIMSGRVPIRANGDGTIPVPGWTDEFVWQGWIPYEELPMSFNPAKGYIVTANNAVVDSAYRYFIDYNANDGDRAQRIVDMIEEIIAGGGKFTVADFARMQVDNKSLLAEAYAPLWAKIESNDAQIQEALTYLNNWDFQADRDSVAAALWEITYLHLVENALADDLGADNVELIERHKTLHLLAGMPEAAWWDVRGTAEIETAVDILAQSLQDAINWLREKRGGRMADWTWGSIHTITFRDGVLGQSGIAPIENIFNRGPLAADGGTSIVNANSWNVNNPAVVRGHPSMRMIVDLSDVEQSLAIHPTGQSGHAFHPHYDDMVELWRNGQYHPMRFGRTAVEAAARQHLILQPAQ